MRFGGDTASELTAPPTGLPMAVWHSNMLESGDFVTAESFDYWRFDQFMSRARVLLDTFQKFRNMAEAAIEDEKRYRE
jgi:hypothetical protein